MYKAIFKNIDYPKYCEYEDYFKKKSDAIAYVNERAKENNIKSPKWVKGNDYFNTQNDNPKDDNSTYFGSVEKIDVK